MGEEEEDDDFQIRSQFFKIMMPGFTERLKLPPAFCDKLKSEKSKVAILECCKRRWEMNVCRHDEDDDEILLEDGWSRFANEHGLRLGDFLVFEHTGKLQFNVRIYDHINACGKQFQVDPNNHHQILPNSTYLVHAHPKSKAGIRNKRACFSHEVTATSIKDAVNVPINFVRWNNLGKKGIGILRDSGGRKWKVKLSVQKWPQFRVRMSVGWRHFAAANKLKIGDVCTFQLLSNHSHSQPSTPVLFHVHISRNMNDH